MPGGMLKPQPLGHSGSNPVSNPRQQAYQMRMQSTASSSNASAAEELRSMMVGTTLIRL